jgi:hypothetical protein
MENPVKSNGREAAPFDARMERAPLFVGSIRVLDGGREWCTWQSQIFRESNAEVIQLDALTTIII